MQPRRLVLLCDISGSMEPYARAYLQFMTCAVTATRHAEAFAFATRLTRLTRALGTRDPERALAQAAATAPDWSSGTRIGDALKAFNDRYGRRGMARGAVIVILSDGWERGDPALVAREMERLRRPAYRIVWVNPRAAATEFAPRAGGMAAALPFCDALLSGHSLKALEQVADAIAAPRGINVFAPAPVVDLAGADSQQRASTDTTDDLCCRLDAIDDQKRRQLTAGLAGELAAKVREQCGVHPTNVLLEIARQARRPSLRGQLPRQRDGGGEHASFPGGENQNSGRRHACSRSLSRK